MIGFEREDDEILRYYERVQPNDVFGVWGTELLLRLPLNKATRFLAPDHGWTPETWEKAMLKKDHESVLAEMEDYFQFGVEKAITHKGLSASRSVHHYLAWAWMIKDMEVFAYFMDPRNYPNYGAPMLLMFAQKYELMDYLPENVYDREVFMRMAHGQRCSDLCPGGCGLGTPQQFRQMNVLLPTSALIVPKTK